MTSTPTNPDRAGWYDDPEHPGQLRYFDGILWTRHVSAPAPVKPAPAPFEAPATAPAGGLPGQAGGLPGQAGRELPAAYRSYGQQPLRRGEVIPGVTSGDGTPYASYGSRVGAFFLDGIIKVALNLILGGWAFYLALRAQIDGYLAAVQRGEQPPSLDITHASAGWLAVYLVIVASIGMIYSVTFLTRRGATPGKMAVGIRVRDIASGDRLTVTAAAKRYLISFATALSSASGIVGSLTLGLWTLDHLMPLFDPRRQALHDKLAGSEVVSSRG